MINRKRRMTQDERWNTNWEEMIRFLKDNHRNLSKYDLTERRLYTRMKHNRKQKDAGLLKEERLGMFKELLALSEQYRRVMSMRRN